MWEFSINLTSENQTLADSIFNSLRQELASQDAIIARTDSEFFISLVIAVQEQRRKETEIALLRVVSIAICQNFKVEYLKKNLSLPSYQDELLKHAFLKALVNFDKETDYFLIAKALEFDGSLFLESFYNFKLHKLKDKWRELVMIANENRDCLVSSEAFFDLLKFLIDNLDIVQGEIDVVEEEQGYFVYDEGRKSLPLTSDALVEMLIDMSPQKINLYFSSENRATDILKTLFDRRINLLRKDEQISAFSKKHLPNT